MQEYTLTYINYIKKICPRSYLYIWLRAEITCFRDQVPERCLARCLVLALGVLKILSASVPLLHSGWWVWSLCVFCLSVCEPLGVCTCLLYASFCLC